MFVLSHWEANPRNRGFLFLLQSRGDPPGGVIQNLDQVFCSFDVRFVILAGGGLNLFVSQFLRLGCPFEADEKPLDAKLFHQSGVVAEAPVEPPFDLVHLDLVPKVLLLAVPSEEPVAVLECVVAEVQNLLQLAPHAGEFLVDGPVVGDALF